MTLPTADRAIVLWNKGQNFFSAFFAEIANIRQQIGNDTAFARWCFEELHLPVTTITRVADVLTLVDAAKAKAELASVKSAEQEQKRKERDHREAMAEAERRRKEEEKAAIAAERARQEELERQRQEAEEKARRKRASKAKNNKGWKKKQREESRVALIELAKASTNVVVLHEAPVVRSESDLVKAIKMAIKRRCATRDEWISATVELGHLLCEARARYPADQRFSKWLDENDIKLNENDRAALLFMGIEPEAFRVILSQTDSTSLQHICRDVKARIGHVTKPDIA